MGARMGHAALTRGEEAAGKADRKRQEGRRQAQVCYIHIT